MDPLLDIIHSALLPAAVACGVMIFGLVLNRTGSHLKYFSGLAVILGSITGIIAVTGISPVAPLEQLLSLTAFALLLLILAASVPAFLFDKISKKYQLAASLALGLAAAFISVIPLINAGTLTKAWIPLAFVGLASGVIIQNLAVAASIAPTPFALGLLVATTGIALNLVALFSGGISFSWLAIVPSTAAAPSLVFAIFKQKLPIGSTSLVVFTAIWFGVLVQTRSFLEPPPMAIPLLLLGLLLGSISISRFPNKSWVSLTILPIALQICSVGLAANAYFNE